MEEENEAIIIAMIIGAVILGIGLAMFFNRLYTGYGAVVLALGLMTLSLIITIRAEEIIHLKIYPTTARSENIEVSVETPSSTEPTPRFSEETQIPEVLEPTESYEAQVEDVQQVQEVEETEQYYTPSIYEPSPSEEAETETQEIEEPQETSFTEIEQEQEQSTEIYPPSSEQIQEAEESQESTTTW